MTDPITLFEEQNLLEQFREAKRALGQLFDQNLHTRVQEALKQFEIDLENRREEFAVTLDAFKSIHLDWPAFIDSVQGHASRIQNELKDSSIMMGRYGWYLDMGMTPKQIVEVGAALYDGHVEEAEDALIAYFERNLDRFESSLINDFPHRARLIQSAFRAHRREEYDLAISCIPSFRRGRRFD